MPKTPHRQPFFHHNLVAAGLVLAVGLLLYVVVNQLTGLRPGVTFVTIADAIVPFMPAAVFGLLFFIPLFIFPFMLISEPLIIRRIAWGIIISIFIVLAVFLALPTRVPRPGIPTQENFLYWLVAFLYISDNPVNCLPAFSLTISIFISLCMWSLARLAGWVSFAATAVVSLSSLLLRQHYLADVLASLVIGYAVYRFFARPVLKNKLPAGLVVSPGEWQRLALRITLVYFGLIGAGLLLFEAGLRFNPVLPTN